jgi:hypothetical protein
MVAEIKYMEQLPEDDDVLSDQIQAILFSSRQRRRSLAGIPNLFRTNRIFGNTVMEVASILAATFPVRDTTVTFKTTIRITAANPVGLVFEFGSTARGVALWVDNNLLSFRAGSTVDDAALASYNNTIDLPVDLEMEIVASIRPGDGRIRMWGNGQEIARNTSVNGDFGSPSEWASSSDGSFAAAAQGTIPADVTQTGVPTNFEVIEPLSVYMGQVPRHFV